MSLIASNSFAVSQLRQALERVFWNNQTKNSFLFTFKTWLKISVCSVVPIQIVDESILRFSLGAWSGNQRVKLILLNQNANIFANNSSIICYNIQSNSQKTKIVLKNYLNRCLKTKPLYNPLYSSIVTRLWWSLCKKNRHLPVVSNYDARRQ